jgi:hypothetical protein
MVLTVEKIEADLQGQYKESFISQFPELSVEIDKFIKSPTCSICRQAFFGKLSALPNNKTRLETFYGPIERVDFAVTAKNSFVQDILVQRVKDSDWASWIKEFNKTTMNQVRVISTYYVPETQDVVATIIYLKKV